MAENTNIEWCDDTWNPWQGCSKVDVDCANCYMFREKKRYGKDPLNIHRSADRTFNMPLRLKGGRVVMVCSWSDFYIEEADGWRGDAWDIMRHRHDLTFIIPTKRPERIIEHLPEGWGHGWRNVWHLLSAGNQETYYKRINYFKNVPGHKGLSLEPLIGPIDFLLGWNLELFERTIHQVIVGGESGPDARPISPQAVRSIRWQCDQAAVPFYFKQWGKFAPSVGGEISGTNMYLNTGNWAGRIFDGKVHNNLAWRRS